MLLTLRLFTTYKGFFKSGKKTKGHMYKGKDRIVFPITLPHLVKLRRDYEREERNMLLLRHPYLTLQQSHGHNAKNRFASHSPAKYAEYKAQRFSKIITTESRLGHLQVNESWDV